MKARRSLLVAVATMAISLAVLTKALAWPDGVAAGLTVLGSGLVLVSAGFAAVRILGASERPHGTDQP